MADLMVPLEPSKKVRNYVFFNFSTNLCFAICRFLESISISWFEKKYVKERACLETREQAGCNVKQAKTKTKQTRKKTNKINKNKPPEKQQPLHYTTQQASTQSRIEAHRTT